MGLIGFYPLVLVILNRSQEYRWIQREPSLSDLDDNSSHNKML